MSSNGAYKKLTFCLVGIAALSRMETQILLQGWGLTQVFSLYEGGGSISGFTVFRFWFPLPCDCRFSKLCKISKYTLKHLQG